MAIFPSGPASFPRQQNTAMDILTTPLAFMLGKRASAWRLSHNEGQGVCVVYVCACAHVCVYVCVHMCVVCVYMCVVCVVHVFVCGMFVCDVCVFMCGVWCACV